MKLPLRFEFGTEADGFFDDAFRDARREAKVFLENLESSSLMGNVDLDQLALIATDAMNLAAEKFSGLSDGKKKEAAQHLFFVLNRLREFEAQMAELRSEIKMLESQINDLESNYEELNSELQTVNRLLEPSKGGEGEYDRAQALHLLGLSSGSEMADADIQALLWERKVAVTEEMTEIEAKLDNARERLHEAKIELSDLKQEASELKRDLDQVDSLDQVSELAGTIDQDPITTSDVDGAVFDQSDQEYVGASVSVISPESF